MSRVSCSGVSCSGGSEGAVEEVGAFRHVIEGEPCGRAALSSPGISDWSFLEFPHDFAYTVS